jgi:hypothetical protein
MTEVDWFKENNPSMLLWNLRSLNPQNQVSSRKLRLVACAFARSVWHLLPHEENRQAIEIAERLAEGELTTTDPAIQDARRKVAQVARISPAAWAARNTLAQSASKAALGACNCVRNLLLPQHSGFEANAWFAAHVEVNGQLCLLPRDIIGNPFSTPGVDPTWLSWNDSTVRKIAFSIYNDRAFERLPILADALADAGCNNDDILNHCREPGVHVRGCWVVDLLLGKS